MPIKINNTMKKFKLIGMYLGLGIIFGMMIVEDIHAFQTQDRPLAIVRRFKPNVVLASLERETFTLDITENIGERLFSGDTLSTDSKGYALVVFTDNSVAKVKPESILIIQGESLASSKISNRRINLDKGELFLDVKPLGSGTFEVATSRSLASVKGTKFGTLADGYIWVQEGQVDVTAAISGQTVSLFEKMFAEIDQQGNAIETGTLTNEKIEELDEDFGELDEELIERTIILRFRDANGQIREIPINILEKGN